MHLEDLVEHLRLMTSTSSKTLLGSNIKVVLKLGLIFGMSTFVDNHLSTFTGRQTTEIGQTLLGDKDVKIVFSLVNMRTHGDNARNTVRILLGRTSGGRVHHTQLGITQEITRTAKTIQNARTTHQGGVGMAIHVEFNGCVHGNTA